MVESCGFSEPTIAGSCLRLRKLFLTTKHTKVTKDSDQFSHQNFLKLRDLRDLRGKDCFLFLVAAQPRRVSMLNVFSQYTRKNQVGPIQRAGFL